MRIIDDEYKGMFKGYMMGKGNCNLKDATAEYDAMVESLNEEQLNEEDADPIYDAYECMSYWSE